MILDYDSILKLPEGTEIWYATFYSSDMPHKQSPKKYHLSKAVKGSGSIRVDVKEKKEGGGFLTYAFSTVSPSSCYVIATTKEDCITLYKQQCRNEIAKINIERRKCINTYNKRIDRLIKLQTSYCKK